MAFLLVLFGVLASVLIYYLFKTKYNHLSLKVENTIPGPKTVPFLGNGLEFLNLDSVGLKERKQKLKEKLRPKKETSSEIRDHNVVVRLSTGSYERLQSICNNYPRFTRIWLGLSCYIVLYEAKDVEVLLSSSSQIRKSNVYKFLYDWIGTGLLTSYGEKWKAHRKLITPTFHFKILEDFLQVFNNNGSILLEKLSENAGKGTFNVYNLINLYTLDNICETALGVQVKAQKDSESEYARAVKDIRNIISIRTLNIWLGFKFILNLSEYGAIYKNALKVLHETTTDVIKKRKKELKDLKYTPVSKTITGNDIHQKKRLAFLDLLIMSGEMSDQDIREEVDTFMFEGHDTVTSGISFALYALAHNQQVQKAVYEEQLEIFGNSDREPLWQDLQNMKYLDMVLKETQRLYPSVPLIGRTIDDDLHLGDGIILPKGSYCTVNVAKLHRDPNVWPSPDKFNPDNFLPDAVRIRNPFSFIPFSAGPRNCIGQRFAMIEMRSCISKIIRKFQIKPSADHCNNAKVAGQLVLFSSNGINIELENRN